MIKTRDVIAGLKGIVTGLIILYTRIRELVLDPINSLGYNLYITITLLNLIGLFDLILLCLLTLLIYMVLRDRISGYPLFAKTAALITLFGLIYTIKYYYSLWNNLALLLSLSFWITYLILQIRKPVKHLTITRFTSALLLTISIYNLFTFISTRRITYYSIFFLLLFVSFTLVNIEVKILSRRGVLNLSPKTILVWILILYISILRTFYTQPVLATFFGASIYMIRLILPQKTTSTSK